MFRYNTKATNAHPKSKSLRATIPKEIVELLDLEHGDTVQWNVDVENNENYRIIVTKKKE